MQELVIVLVIAVIIFGPSRLPQLGRAIGETIQSFRGAKKELDAMHRDGFSDE